MISFLLTKVSCLSGGGYRADVLVIVVAFTLEVSDLNCSHWTCASMNSPRIFVSVYSRVPSSCWTLWIIAFVCDGTNISFWESWDQSNPFVEGYLSRLLREWKPSSLADYKQMKCAQTFAQINSISVFLKGKKIYPSPLRKDWIFRQICICHSLRTKRIVGVVISHTSEEHFPAKIKNRVTCSTINYLNSEVLYASKII